jgi:hypothetical protein
MLLQAYPFQATAARLEIHPTINQRRPFCHNLLYPVGGRPRSLIKKRHSATSSTIKARQSTHLEDTPVTVDYTKLE